MTRAELLALADRAILSSHEAVAPLPTGMPGVTQSPHPAVVHLASGLRDVALALRALAEGMNDEK